VQTEKLFLRKANVLNDYFVSVFTLEDLSNMPSFPDVFNDAPMADDFSKDFDSVPHERLLVKLEAHGIKGKVLQWILGFLTERKQAIVVDGVKSTTNNVLSGVPQGSVIGPLLFLIYITDLPSIVSSQVLLFADDVKLFTPLISHSFLHNCVR